MWWVMLWMTLGYVVVGLVSARVTKQVEFSNAVKDMEDCETCLIKTRRHGELHWCKDHDPDKDSLAGPIGWLWPIAFVIFAAMLIYEGTGKVLFPRGRKNKRSERILEQIRIDALEAEIARRQAEIEKQHQKLGIEVPGDN